MYNENDKYGRKKFGHTYGKHMWILKGDKEKGKKKKILIQKKKRV